MSVSYWDKPAVVAYWAAQTRAPSVAYRLAWLDVLRRNLDAGRRLLRVLDVGTGTGLLAHLLAELGHSATGLDQSDAMLETAQSQAGARNLAGDFVLGDAAALRFEPETFDAVTARYTLSVLADPAAALAQWQRVLKPGGRVLIVEDDRQSEAAQEAAEIKRFVNRRRNGAVFSAEYDALLRQAPLADADQTAIGRALTQAGFADVQTRRLAGQLEQSGRWLLWRYTLPQALIIATKPGGPNRPIPLRIEATG